MMLFQDAVVNGTLENESAVLYAYGIYLMHGGTPEGFGHLNSSDIQILLYSYTGTNIRQNKVLIESIAHVKNYPSSIYWNDANKRIKYLRRFYYLSN